MACGQRVPKSRKIPIKIVNPMPGGSQFTTYDRARRFINRNRAHFDASGRLVFHAQSKPVAQCGGNDRLMVDSYGGSDARPGMPILPPSAELLAKASGYRGPVRPPLA